MRAVSASTRHLTCAPHNNGRTYKYLRNPLFLWIMRALMQHLSAYTRRTKLLARNENESKYPPKLPGSYRDVQLRQQFQDQVGVRQAGTERRGLLRMPPVLHRHAKDCGYRRPHRQVPPEIRHQGSSVTELRAAVPAQKGSVCCLFHLLRQFRPALIEYRHLAPNRDHRNRT